jgi:hypothetical protein
LIRQAQAFHYMHVFHTHSHSLSLSFYVSVSLSLSLCLTHTLSLALHLSLYLSMENNIPSHPVTINAHCTNVGNFWYWQKEYQNRKTLHTNTEYFFQVCVWVLLDFCVTNSYCEMILQIIL